MESQRVISFLPQIPNRLYNSASAEPFLNGSNTSYVEEMYNSWLRDPASVHAVRKKSFINIEFNLSIQPVTFSLSPFLICSHGTRTSATTRTPPLRHWPRPPRVTCPCLSIAEEPHKRETLAPRCPRMSE